jgi:FtsP/CotA-like multicopper oxidase with cupredoxin domain
MLAYNGSIPVPLLRVPQGSDITVAVTNNAGREQTVHWHERLRVERNARPHVGDEQFRPQPHRVIISRPKLGSRTRWQV